MLIALRCFYFFPMVELLRFSNNRTLNELGICEKTFTDENFFVLENCFPKDFVIPFPSKATDQSSLSIYFPSKK